ncbi:MAG TPA: MMPL family transporter [Dermatophilaceae bacterium]|nr:MMPL family transporter [Dermatophilaceae bacterium]
MADHDPRQGVLLRRWGRMVGRHARVVLLLWLLFIVGGLGAALGAFGNQALFDRLQSGEMVAPGENDQGRMLLEEAGATGFTTTTLLLDGVDLASPTVAAAATDAARTIAAVPSVDSVANPFVVPGGPTGAQGATFVADGDPASGGFATVVTFDRNATDEQVETATGQVDAAFDDLTRATGATESQRGGVTTLVDAIVTQVQDDAKRGEGIALPVSFAVMVVVFGGFLAAGLPILGAIASIAGALLSLLAFSHLLDLDASVVNVVTVLGLGLSIDYGLLVVSRYREELRAILQGAPLDTLTREQALVAGERCVDRAGRTVIFSGLIVAISLGGLSFFDITFIRAVSAAGVSVVLLALAVALSLVPALCVLSARRLLRRGGTETAPDTGVFSRLADGVHRRPWFVVVGVSALLVVAAIPSLDMRLTSSGPELLPVGHPQRVLFEDLADRYPELGGADVTVVTEAPLPQVQAWATTAADRPGVLAVDPATDVGSEVVTVGFRTEGGALDPDARALTADLREDRPPFPAYVVGQASSLTDFVDAVRDRAPYAIAVVALVTLVLLFLMTGSVVIPLKALLMNVISLGASLGLLVWVFQYGHLEELLNFSSVGAIEATVPVLVVAFGFGLAMDYEVFLLSRIVELHEQGLDSNSAVTLGLQRSGRIITSAALLMVIVFSGFAAGELLVMKQVGLALVIAVVLDATLVRMLLVPATMSVLGNANWWAPPALRRLHDRWGITE